MVCWGFELLIRFVLKGTVPLTPHSDSALHGGGMLGYKALTFFNFHY